MIDISKNGLKLTVTSKQRVFMGKYLKLRLALPDQQLPLKVESAAVRWSRGGQFGLELLYLDTAGSDRLEQFVTALEKRRSD